MVEGRAILADVEPGQVDRCLESLLADGLVALADAERGLVELA
jgi:A/G-specific adenine glycosylase